MNPLKSIRTAILLGLFLVSGAAGAQDAYLFSYFDAKFQACCSHTATTATTGRRSMTTSP